MIVAKDKHVKTLSSAATNLTIASSIVMRGDPSLLFFAFKVAVVCAVFWNHFKVHALVAGPAASAISTRSFTTTTRSGRTATTTTELAFAADPSRGMGMGMGKTAAIKKNKGGKNKSKTNNQNNKAMSKPFDVNASLIRLEKKYDELTRNAAKELLKDDDDEFSSWDATAGSSMMTSEYVIAARAASKRSTVLDWVPIAQLCLKRPDSQYQEGAADAMVQTAISYYCRELSHVAAIGAPVFSTIARNELQYSVEPVDSFHKFVYDEVVEGKANQNQDETMTKAEARETLGLLKADTATSNGVKEISKADIKQAYRKLSFELHPDRFAGTPEESEAAAQRFARVKIAYETLSSGVRGDDGISWYESLGGRARTSFVGPVDLVPLSVAQEHMDRHKAEAAVLGLEPGLVQSFVVRHLRSE